MAPALLLFVDRVDYRSVALGYNDADRADALLSGVVGKRLTYQTIGAA